MKYRVDLKSLKTEIERKGFQSVEELSEKSRINERELTLVLDGEKSACDGRYGGACLRPGAYSGKGE